MKSYRVASLLILLITASSAFADKDVSKHVTNICKGTGFNIYRFDQPVITFSFFGQGKKYRPYYEKAVNELNDILSGTGKSIVIVDDNDKSANVQYTLTATGAWASKHHWKYEYNPNKTLYRVYVSDDRSARVALDEEEEMRQTRLNVLPCLGFFNKYFSTERTDTIWSKLDDQSRRAAILTPEDEKYRLSSEYTKLDREIIRFYYTLPINTPPWKITQIAKKKFETH